LHRAAEAGTQLAEQVRVVAPPAYDDPLAWHDRQALRFQSDGGSRECRKRRGTAFRRQCRDRVERERVAIQGLGSAASKIGIPEQTGQRLGIDAPRHRDPAAIVIVDAAAVPHPVIDEGIAWTAITGVDPLPVNERAVRHSPDVEHRDWLRECAGTHQGPVVRRRQGRTLTTVIHIVLTKGSDDGDAQRVGHALAGAELPGSALLRLMQDGLAVKSDKIDRAKRQAFSRAQIPHCLGLQVGHLPFNVREIDIQCRQTQ
jgi:hypothetical protein